MENEQQKEDKKINLAERISGKLVAVHLSNNTVIRGTLVTMDAYLNVVLENMEEYPENSAVSSKYGEGIIRGSAVDFISMDN